MQEIVFSRPMANITGKNAMTFKPETTINEATNENCCLKVSPVLASDLTLSIGLTFASDGLGGWDITATLTITNNTAVSVDVEINAASFTPSSGITWSDSSVTIAAGATDATVTGTYNVGSADTYTISGQVQGVETGETAPTYYSNVDSESIAVS